jgi:hypothetical protein
MDFGAAFFSSPFTEQKTHCGYVGVAIQLSASAEVTRGNGTS